MAEVIEVLKKQARKLNSVIEGLEDKSKLSYPKEYDYGAALLKEIIEDLTTAKNQLTNSVSLERDWLLYLIKTLTLRG